MNKLKCIKGYTLIELIVTMLVMSIVLGAMVFSGNVTTRNREVFRQSVDEVTSFFRAARNYAITNEAVDPGTGVLSVPEGGFGVFIDKNDKTVVLFIDSYDGTEASQAAMPNGPNLKFDENYDREHPHHSRLTISEQSVVIESIKLDGDDVDQATVIFKPSSADVFINDNNPANSFNNIEITMGSPWEKRNISMNRISAFFEIKLVE